MSELKQFAEIMESMKAYIDHVEKEAYQKGFETGQHEATTLEYQQGLNDAWGFASHLAYVSDSVTDSIYISANGGKGLLVAFGMTYEEAKKTYDEHFDKKRKADERIMFGDGLVTKTEGLRGIALSNEVNGSVYVWREDCVAYEASVDEWKKTGKTYSQLAELLEAMKGKQRGCSTCKYSDGSDVSKCSDCCLSKGYNKWELKEGAE